MDRQLNRRLPTGTYCGGNHPEQIEYRYTLVDGAEVPSGQSGPRCFRAGCPDNDSALRKEQRGVVDRAAPARFDMDTKQKGYGESTGQGSDDDLGPRSVLPSKAKWSE